MDDDDAGMEGQGEEEEYAGDGMHPSGIRPELQDPKTTALIFGSGKMVCTGAKSEELARLAARKYARIIQKIGFQAKFTEFKIQNIVGSCDVKFPIRLEKLAFAHGQYCSYEPELFPGLIYRMLNPKVPQNLAGTA